MSKNKGIIWDLPIRVFHLVFALGITVAWIIGQTASHKSETFLYHTLIALTVAFALAFRLIYGVLAKGHASLSGFFFSPKELIVYLKSVSSKEVKSYVGHNPGSAYVSLAMMVTLIGLVATGIAMGKGNHDAEEIHEILAGFMSFLVGAHILGILIYTFKSKQNISMSMLNGKKEVSETSLAMRSKTFLGIVFALLIAAWAFGLILNFDAKTKTTKLPLTSVEIQLKKVSKKNSDH